MAPDQFEVIKQHLAPYIPLTIGKAIVIKMLLPSRNLFTKESLTYFVDASKALPKHVAYLLI
jgi:hypothetical protein